MKRLFVLLMVLGVSVLLSSCVATPSKMRRSAPDVVHSSQKTPKEVAVCIADKWENWGTVNQRETQNGYSLTAGPQGKLHYLTDIEETETGSRTKVYKFHKILMAYVGTDPYYGSAALCQ